MGLLFLLLLVEARGWDVIPDPVGWLLVAVGVRRLPEQVPQGALLYLAAVAGLVSLALWPALPGDPLGDVDPSLQWAMNLPQLLFCTLLAWRLAAAAAAEPTARALLRLDAGMFAAAAVLPPIVFGGGVRALEQPSYLIAGLALMTFVVLLFVYSGRDWAAPAERAA